MESPEQQYSLNKFPVGVTDLCSPHCCICNLEDYQFLAFGLWADGLDVKFLEIECGVPYPYKEISEQGTFLGLKLDMRIVDMLFYAKNGVVDLTLTGTRVMNTLRMRLVAQSR